jgi:hypothetical protein
MDVGEFAGEGAESDVVVQGTGGGVGWGAEAGNQHLASAGLLRLPHALLEQQAG